MGFFSSQQILDGRSSPRFVKCYVNTEVHFLISGKSVLARYLVETGLPRSATICYFFFKDQLQNTLKQALCALLHQLFSQKPTLIRHAILQFSDNGSQLIDVPSLLWNILQQGADDVEAGPITFVLDALDECVESDFRDLSRMLRQRFLDDKSGQVKFLLTTRPYDGIISHFQGLIEDFPRIHIPADEESEIISEEINLVIEYRVRQLAKAKRLSDYLSEYLERRLLEFEHRTYLWVYLVFDYLESEGFKKTERGIAASLQGLPKDVNQAYERILSKSKDNEKARLLLGMTLAAERPLTLAEMNVAVHAHSARSCYDMDLEDDEDFRKTLRNWCGLFVNIYNGKVEFLHQTAREFLIQKPSEAPGVFFHWQGSMSIMQAHAMLAESCVAYLNFPDLDIKDPGEKSDSAIDAWYLNIIRSRPYFQYSASRWPLHFRLADYPEGAGLIPSVLRLCSAKEEENCELWLLAYWWWHMEWDRSRRERWSELHVASYLGLNTIVEVLLLQYNMDANAVDGIGDTPLTLAAGKGHTRVAELLILHGADPNKANDEGDTALLKATRYGHIKIAKLLLDKGADPQYGRC